jgi:hypothetical protein
MSTRQAGPADRRRRRAALAEALLARPSLEPGDAAALDWAVLDQAPEWLAWPAPALAALQSRVGALHGAAEVRLWIDAARVAAARVRLGQAYLTSLLALPAAGLVPSTPSALPPISRPDDVAPSLQAAGAGVLLAALPAGPLRQAVQAAWAPAMPAVMAAALAQALIDRALALAPFDPHDPALPVPATTAAPVKSPHQALELAT